MSPDRWIATAAGLALIAFIVWFFWLKSSTEFRASETTGGYQEAMILVRGLFARHHHRSERPAGSVELPARRDGVLLGQGDLRRFSEECRPPHRADCLRGVAAEVARRFGFGRPMGMFRGKLVVE